jgi:hypothetical protein
MDTEKCRKMTVFHQRRGYLKNPEVRHKNNLRSIARDARIRKEKMDTVTKFISDNNLDVCTGVLSDEDAFQYIVELMDDKTTAIGKDIFDALGGMTLRTSLWDGGFNGAVYALTARGEAFGGAHAEYIRFLVNNRRNQSTLTHPDGKHFKYSDPEFKNLKTTFVPIRICNSFANCTTMESAFQLLFDYLDVGSRRLWLRSGTGRSSLALRKSDMKYIEVTGDKNPKFVFGITIIKNVSVLERTTDSNEKEIVSFIKCGLGTTCKVNQPKTSKPIWNKSQRKALKTAQETLGPNYMVLKECRKRKAEFMGDSVMRW